MSSNNLNRRTMLTALAASSTAIATSSLLADNWAQWRGEGFTGIAQGGSYPTKWSETENVSWKAALPGPGGATPVLWDDKLFLTYANDSEGSGLLCYSTSGKKLWSLPISKTNKNVRGNEGNSASPSPATDGKHVWAMVTSGEFVCCDFTGKEVWKTNLAERYGPFRIAFGMTSTPVLDGDRIYCQFMYTGGAHVVCLDKATGKEIWKSPRETGATNENEHTYASPLLYRDSKREYLITHGSDFIVAYDLKNGKELWRCGGLNPHENYHKTLRFVASPGIAEGIIIVPTAKNGPVVALKTDLSGDVTNKADAKYWDMKKGTPDVPSPLVHDGLVYLCSEKGLLTCLEAKTGKVIYGPERTHGYNHRANPVLAGGNLYLTARDGFVSVVKIGKEFEIVSTNELDDDISATPVFSKGKIYIRGFKNLYCIG
jgi:outer membrane protein assembly factor BamB